MSRGWHPARKTKPGQRQEKALKMSYKAWDLGAQTEANTLASACVLSTCYLAYAAEAS